MRGLLLLMVVPGMLAAGAPAAAQAVCTRGEPGFPMRLFRPDLEVVASISVPPSSPAGSDLYLLARASGVSVAVPEGDFALYRLDAADGFLDGEFIARIPGLPGITVEPRLLSGDLDGDGRADLVVALFSSYGPGPHMRAEPFRRGEDGVFRRGAPLEIERGPSSSNIALGDVDADGRDELLLLSLLDRTLAAWGATDDGWRLEVSRSAGGDLFGLVAVDLDRDGDDDAVAWNVSAPEIDRFPGDPVAPLEQTFVDPIGFSPHGWLVPWRHAGGVGLLLSEWRYAARTMRLHALGPAPLTGALVPLWQVDLPRRARGYAAFDLDGDPNEDIVFHYSTFGHYMGPGSEGLSFPPVTGFGFEVLEGRGPLPPVPRYAARGAPRLVHLQDVDGDGVRDAILLGVRSRRGLLWYPGLAEGGFAEPAIYHDEEMRLFQRRLAVDFDRDGTLDILGWNASPPGPVANLAFARGLGDGAFEPRNLGPLPENTWRLEFADLDRDGHLDAITVADPEGRERALRIAWGGPGAEFGPFHSWATLRFHDSLRIGDLDGDGDLDLLGLPVRGTAAEQELWPIRLDGRDPVQLDTPLTAPAGCDGNFVLLLADIDDDGADDLVHEECLDPATGREGITWRPVDRDLRGTGASRLLVAWDDPMRGARSVQVRDLDGDGRGEIVVQTGDGLTGAIRVLRRAGDGALHVLWDGTVPFDDAGLLLDLDRDGSLDLVFDAPVLAFVPGDGTGRFEVPRLRSWHLEFDPRLGDFTGDGWLDALGWFQQRVDEYWRVLHEQRPVFAASDALAPELRVTMTPLVDDRSLPVAFADRWRVATTIRDACDLHPRVTRRLLELPELPADAAFHRDATRKIRVYASEGAAQRAVVLRGPDEQEMRDILDAVTGDGGFALDRIEELEMTLTDEWGASPAAWDDGGLVPGTLRLVRRWVLAGDGRLVAAHASEPGSDLRVVASGVDASGHATAASASLRTAQAEACDRFGVACTRREHADAP